MCQIILVLESITARIVFSVKCVATSDVHHAVNRKKNTKNVAVRKQKRTRKVNRQQQEILEYYEFQGEWSNVRYSNRQEITGRDEIPVENHIDSDSKCHGRFSCQSSIIYTHTPTVIFPLGTHWSRIPNYRFYR